MTKGWLDLRQIGSVPDPERYDSTFFHFGSFMDPRTFEMVDGVGFRSLMISEMSREDFETTYTGCKTEWFDHVAEVTRPLGEWRPAAEKIEPLLLWSAQQNQPWSAAAVLSSSSAGPTVLTLRVSFPSAVTAVEFKLKNG
jgi:hypothetical protein